jgi:DNA-binding NarL/FixJ family response regulator
MAIRVVIVEDHLALRQGLELLLRSRGCVVAGAAADADEGLRVIVEARPDVAIVDIRLGERDGIWLTREVLGRDPDQAIVLYTGASEEELLDAGLDSGARGVALKDGTPDELLDALAAVAAGGSYVDPRLHPALLSRRGSERRPGLSPREREIMDLLAQGLTGEQVAEHLVVSSETVKTHVRNAMAKLEASTRVHAIAIAIREGYIRVPHREEPGRATLGPPADPRPSGITPLPSGITPRPSGITPRPSGITPRPSGITPRPSARIP